MPYTIDIPINTSNNLRIGPVNTLNKLRIGPINTSNNLRYGPIYTLNKLRFAHSLGPNSMNHQQPSTYQFIDQLYNFLSLMIKSFK